jgi:hypothetical protein
VQPDLTFREKRTIDSEMATQTALQQTAIQSSIRARLSKCTSPLTYLPSETLGARSFLVDTATAAGSVATGTCATTCSLYYWRQIDCTEMQQSLEIIWLSSSLQVRTVKKRECENAFFSKESRFLFNPNATE